MNIVLTRIDNRLIHGQVAVTWCHHTNANLIVVVNDKVAKDEIRKNIMNMAVPPGVGVRYFTVDEAVLKLPKASPKQFIMLVVETPQDVLRLVEAGIPIKTVNVGNMHYSEGKVQISSTVSVSQDDIDTFKKLISKGVKCIIQRVPTEKGVDIEELINNL
ncbi:PTS N-acetylgalactosamine transporter subunit IIB [Tepidanaerobacter syntrophicus]|uniref:PTS N-acetylgalactosamine transporter subunit IIB n=1 Tax=Tepidanaerobacter syntrophicus TaxID=224999 RepID=UPI00175FF7EE|nr:PTS N-acetylgalactosamine transporter subunit IIB [Tepidanaerobacter syntrophicus]HHV83295.1 PTS sugar transporter subunit IIB [Tepidanaerobacter syntrophicus]